MCVDQARQLQEVVVRDRDDKVRLVREADDVTAQTRKRFSKLRPPQDLKDPFDEFVGLVAEAERFTDEPRSKTDLERVQRRTQELSKTLGLTSCAKG